MNPSRVLPQLFFLAFSLAMLSACKEKNDEYPPRIWSEYSYTGSGITPRDISVIFYENDHSIWLGAKDKEGLLHNDGYKWAVYDYSTTGIDFDSVTSVIRDGNNTLWVGWKSGLAAFDGNNWQEISQFKGLRVTSIAVVGIGEIQVGIKGISGGMATLQDKVWHFQMLINSDIQSGNINSLVSGNDQIAWLASNDKGIFRYKYDEWESMSTGLPILSQNFSTLTKSPDGSIWAGSEASQLIHFYDSNFSILNTGTSKPITTLAASMDNTIWIGTSGAGIISFDGKNWKSYTAENEAMPSDSIMYLTTAGPGYLLFSVSGGKLYLLKP